MWHIDRCCDAITTGRTDYSVCRANSRDGYPRVSRLDGSKTLDCVAETRHKVRTPKVTRKRAAILAVRGLSRIATILPLLRGFLMVTIVTVTAMVILSSLGVNIGPLIAAASVLGLAIGFGAQSPVAIISGIFFLVDDAFRKGEYIDVGGNTGTVEQISVRSMQLRHHNGPLHTIPYSQINTLTNFSRDWVIMKFELRIAFEEDVEKVRKLVKKVGQKLLEDPEHGPDFLEPLKSGRQSYG